MESHFYFGRTTRLNSFATKFNKLLKQCWFQRPHRSLCLESTTLETKPGIHNPCERNGLLWVQRLKTITQNDILWQESDKNIDECM